MIFAEGTRSPDGHVARFRAGSFLLAIEAGLPVVPIAVIGTRRVMPKGRLRTEPADVTLVVHDPIRPPALDQPTPRDAKAFARAIQDAGYATDPAYALKLIGLMDRYNLYRFDQ